MTPSHAHFKPPYLSLTRGEKTSDVISAEASISGVGGSRALTLQLHTSHHPTSVLSKNTLSGDISNMASLARLLTSNCPTAAIHGESEWALATELPNGDLLLCLKAESKEVIAEEDDLSFILDAFSLPGIRFHITPPSNRVKNPSISFKWDATTKFQSAETRLWEWKGGSIDVLMEKLLEGASWTVFENVIL